jgi:hypothetical protein
MDRFAFGVAVSTTLVGVAMATAVTAAAVPTGNSSAADAVKTLQDMGYSVQVNGEVVGPVSECTVTAVHGLSETAFGTAYVDVTCPSGNN